jgi:hypothetical protein
MKPENENYSNNIKWVMDLPGGMYAVRLTGKTAAWRESQKLNLRISHLDILDSIDTDEYYAIRTRDGHACVMFRVHYNTIYMCRGMNRMRPIKYTNQIVTFIVESGFDIAADMACTGLIRQNDRYYNIYDLPQNFVVHGNMDLSYAGLRYLPNMKGMTIRGDYDISGNCLVGFSGVPSVVEGDFIIRHNRFPNLATKRPQYIKIGGNFITDFNSPVR